MQLDLFNDNRPGILLRIADEFIIARDFTQALSVYEELIADYPDDRHSHALLALVAEWRALLSGNSGTPDDLNTIWQRLGSITHQPLHTSVLGILFDALSSFPEPEMIYIPPRFHLGNIMMDAGRHSDAAECFRTALSKGVIPRGRFLVWRGNALTLVMRDDDAIDCYLAAFLDDPRSVEWSDVNNQTMHKLGLTFGYEDEDIDEVDETAWLPVWGWLQGVFPLPMKAAPDDSTDAASFEAGISDGIIPVPRLWFDLLAYAETLRTIIRNDREMTAVRRLMKGLNSFMFRQYLEKIRGTRP